MMMMMMQLPSLLLVLTILTFQLVHISSQTATTISTRQLRGRLNSHANDEQHLTTILCRITTFDTLYVSKTTNASTTTEVNTCIPIVNDIETDLDFPIDLSADISEQYAADIKMGKLLVSISNASLVNDKLVVGDNSKFTVINDPKYRHLQERHLQITSTMTVAMIRISTLDSVPTATATTLSNTLFGTTGINFQTQYDACSFGKLKWQLIPNGVIEVQLPKYISEFASSSDLVTAAQQHMKTAMGYNEVSQIANKVMMCLPPGTGDWAASAGVNHWRAQFNNDWCTSLSGTVHEMGHTLGLLHANADGVDYADRTGYMGSGYSDTYYPRKCFNGYNSWKFGWYSTRHLQHNPLTQGDGVFKLATFVDYDKVMDDDDEYVVANIADQYYLEYNRAKGFNVDTEQKADQVTITEPLATGTTSHVGLGKGDRFSVENFQGSGKTLIVEACDTGVGSGGSDYMVISIAMDTSLCPPPSGSATVFNAPPLPVGGNSIIGWVLRILSQLLNRLRT